MTAFSLLRKHALGLAELPFDRLRRIVERDVDEDDVDNALDECEDAGGDECEALVRLLANTRLEFLFKPRLHEAQTPPSLRWKAVLASTHGRREALQAQLVGAHVMTCSHE